jgi:hypothetical protein
MKWAIIIIARHALEKLPAFGPIEIAGLVVLTICSLETVRKWKRQALWLGTSIRNQAHDEVVLPIFQASQGLCSNPAIAVFGRERLASSLCGFGIFALAVPQCSGPASSRKASGITTCHLLPHENELSKKSLRFTGKMSRPSCGMNQRAKGQFLWAMVTHHVSHSLAVFISFLMNQHREARFFRPEQPS